MKQLFLNLVFLLNLYQFSSKEISIRLFYCGNGIDTSLSVLHADGTRTIWNANQMKDDYGNYFCTRRLFLTGGIGDTIQIIITSTNYKFQFLAKAIVGETKFITEYPTRWRCNDTEVRSEPFRDSRLRNLSPSDWGEMIKPEGGIGTFLFELTIPPQVYCSWFETASIKAPYARRKAQFAISYAYIGRNNSLDLEVIYPQHGNGCISGELFPLFGWPSYGYMTYQNEMMLSRNRYPLDEYGNYGFDYGSENMTYFVKVNEKFLCKEFVFELVVCYKTCKKCERLGFDHRPGGGTPIRRLSGVSLPVPDDTEHLCIECAENYEMDPNHPGNCIPMQSYLTNMVLAKLFYEANINIYDVFDPFFRDICVLVPFDNTTDATRKDKINFYLQDNSTLCSSKCLITGINWNLSEPDCQCPPLSKKTGELSFEGMKSNALATLIEANYEVIFCYMLVFNSKIFVKNVGSWVLIGIGIVVVGNLIYSFIKSVESFIEYLKRLHEVLVNNNNNNNNSKDTKLPEVSQNNKEMITLRDIENHNEKDNPNANDNDNGNDNEMANEDANENEENEDANENEDVNENEDANENEEGKENENEKNEEVSNEYNRDKDENISRSMNLNINMSNDLKSSKRFLKHNQGPQPLPLTIYSSFRTPKVITGDSSTKLNNYINPSSKTSSKTKDNPPKKEEAITSSNIEYYDDMDYEDIIEKDKRNILLIYWGYIRLIHPIINTFFVNNIRVLKSVKISKFLIGIMLDIFFTSFFYSDLYISNNTSKSGVADYLYNLPVSVFTYLTTSVISVLIGLFSNSESAISKLEQITIPSELSEKSSKFIKTYKIKLIVYNVFQIALLIFFWYYTAAFCAVYQHTQRELFISYAISMTLSMGGPFIISLGFSISRLIVIKYKCKSLHIIMTWLMWLV